MNCEIGESKLRQRVNPSNLLKGRGFEIPGGRRAVRYYPRNLLARKQLGRHKHYEARQIIVYISVLLVCTAMH